MQWSVMLVEVPPADTNSKLHHYKKKVQKVTDIPKRWVLRGKQFEDFRQKKEQKQFSRPFTKTQWNTGAQNTSIEQGPRKE